MSEHLYLSLLFQQFFQQSVDGEGDLILLQNLLHVLLLLTQLHPAHQMTLDKLVLALVVLHRHAQLGIQVGEIVLERFYLVFFVQEVDLCLLLFLLDFPQVLDLLNVGVVHGVFGLPFVQENPLVQVLDFFVFGLDYLLEGGYLFQLVLQHVIEVIFLCSFEFHYFFLQLQDLILPNDFSLYCLFLLVLEFL